MSAKEKKRVSKIVVLISFILLILIIIYIKNLSNKYTYATDEVSQLKVLPKISNAKEVDLDKIINSNVQNIINKVEIYEKQEELEYITKYRNNNDLYIGTTSVSQEGRNGIQTITIRKTYDNSGNVINEEQVSCVVTKSSINKIIDIGTKKYIEPKKTEQGTSSNSNSSVAVDFDIALNKPSGFSLDQFKVALSDDKDLNKIFTNNAEYFYYIEDEYNINGLFVAAMGIHESAWGTSKLAKDKYNLFGYGAFDSNPYNGAYSFSTYSESIDLIARVLVKYYLNPSGTKIYDGQVASRKIL